MITSRHVRKIIDRSCGFHWLESTSPKFLVQSTIPYFLKRHKKTSSYSPGPLGICWRARTFHSWQAWLCRWRIWFGGTTSPPQFGSAGLLATAPGTGAAQGEGGQLGPFLYEGTQPIPEDERSHYRISNAFKGLKLHKSSGGACPRTYTFADTADERTCFRTLKAHSSKVFIDCTSSCFRVNAQRTVELHKITTAWANYRRRRKKTGFKNETGVLPR